MRTVIDISGRRFGRLTVLRQAGRYISPAGRSSTLWLCRCDCGSEIIQRGDRLKSGDVVSCGCYKEEIASERLRKWHQKKKQEKEKQHADQNR